MRPKFHVRRWLSALLILLLLAGLMPMPFAAANQSAANQSAAKQSAAKQSTATTSTAEQSIQLIIHYQRTAKDYEGWDLWLWQEGAEGKGVAFAGEDAYGKYWAIDDLKAARYGFIVRKGNWEAKDVGTDRFLDLSTLAKDGVAEVWLKQDQEAIITTVPEGAVRLGDSSANSSGAAGTANNTAGTANNTAGTANNASAAATIKESGALDLIVHYRRFDGAYDAWNLWVWPKTKEGKSYTFTGKDDFGAIAEIPMTGLQEIADIGIIVRKGEWEQKDTDADRFIPVSKVGVDGKLHVYIVQGTEPLYYNIKDIDLSPRFLRATLIDEKAIQLSTSMPIKKSELRKAFAIVGTTGHTLKPAGVSASGDIATEFVITFNEAVHMGEAYKTNYGSFKAVPLDIAGLYDTEAFEKAYGYDGPLGAEYSKDKTTFRVWSPVAASMTLKLYHEGHGGSAYETIPMSKAEKGLWEATKAGNLAGKYYTYTITYRDAAAGAATGTAASTGSTASSDPGATSKETYDPYAVSAGVNGDRSMVTDLEALKPEGFGVGKLPIYKKANDVVVYEMHIRDLTNHESSGATNKGKYLGVVESGTAYQGAATGLDHLKALGITHVQILPMYDYNSIDETRLEDNQFNWGYDPKNYSVPEGSYATNPYDGRVRVKELRQMVEGLHQAGIGVIMDVVYNHTALSADSNLDILVPGYYYRMVNGKFSNGSGTGNETASERYMVRRLMVDSLKHWVRTYQIDGFRFDLMGVHDTETMALIEKELRTIKPDIILYGEGWTGGTAALPEGRRLVKKNIFQVPGIGAFNDDFRDAIKGHVFEAEAPGFVAGAQGFIDSLRFGFIGAGEHPQINYANINYSKRAWTQNPSQSVNYVSAHDNLTLWDKLAVTAPEAIEAQRTSMQRLANAMVLTAQGMPFLHAGVEMHRTKEGDHNSYKSPDSVNNINWQWKLDNKATVDYYTGLIALRKAYPQLRLATSEEVAARVRFLETSIESLIGFEILPTEDQARMVLLFNGSGEAQAISLPEGSYQVLVDNQSAGAEASREFKGGMVTIPGISALILVQKSAYSSIFGVFEEGNIGFIVLALFILVLAIAGYWYYKRPTHKK